MHDFCCCRCQHIICLHSPKTNTPERQVACIAGGKGERVVLIIERRDDDVPQRWLSAAGRGTTARVIGLNKMEDGRAMREGRVAEGSRRVGYAAIASRTTSSSYFSHKNYASNYSLFPCTSLLRQARRRQQQHIIMVPTTLFLLLLNPLSTKAEQPNPCLLYQAQSTIENASLSMFTDTTLSPGQLIGRSGRHDLPNRRSRLAQLSLRWRLLL